MRVSLNGQGLELREGSTISDAVLAAGAEPGRRGIAVAVEGEVVPRSIWDRTSLSEGQRIEVLQPMQGG